MYASETISHFLKKKSWYQGSIQHHTSVHPKKLRLRLRYRPNCPNCSLWWCLMVMELSAIFSDAGALSEQLAVSAHGILVCLCGVGNLA